MSLTTDQLNQLVENYAERIVDEMDLMQTAFVTPISKKAKNRLANLMDGNTECIVEQNTGRSLFLTSMNRKYHFWMSLDNDANWMVEL